MDQDMVRDVQCCDDDHGDGDEGDNDDDGDGDDDDDDDAVILTTMTTAMLITTMMHGLKSERIRGSYVDVRPELKLRRMYIAKSMIRPLRCLLEGSCSKD